MPNPRTIALPLVLATAALLLGGALLWRGVPLGGWDEALLLWINQGWASGWGDRLFAWISEQRTFTAPLLLAILALLAWRHGKAGLALWVVMAVMVFAGDQIGNLLKSLFEQPRPCAILAELVRQPKHLGGGSCGAMVTGTPSSHALNFWLVATFLGLALRSRPWFVAMGLIAAAVSLSRIYLGVHFPSQVALGGLVGALLGLGAGHALRRSRLGAAVAEQRDRV